MCDESVTLMPTRKLILVIGLLLLAVMAAPAVAAKEPPLWGYGVKSCKDYAGTAAAAAAGDVLAGTERKRYREWLAGFLSGLNLATGQDNLRGAKLDKAMERIQAHCEGHPDQDFFNATMDLVRTLMKLG